MRVGLPTGRKPCTHCADRCGGCASSRPERERGPDADTSRGHLLLSVLPLVCVCVCGPDDACLTTRAVRVCIPWRATVYERCRLRCSCVCTRLWSAGCEKALRLLMMTSLVGGRGSFIFRGSRSRSRSSVTWRLLPLQFYSPLAGVMSAPCST